MNGCLHIANEERTQSVQLAKSFNLCGFELIYQLS
jgi:hypothetical protein